MSFLVSPRGTLNPLWFFCYYLANHILNLKLCVIVLKKGTIADISNFQVVALNKSFIIDGVLMP